MAEVSAVVAVMSVQPTSERRTFWHDAASAAMPAVAMAKRPAPKVAAPKNLVTIEVIWFLPVVSAETVEFSGRLQETSAKHPLLVKPSISPLRAKNDIYVLIGTAPL
jgi:hypothetical protein